MVRLQRDPIVLDALVASVQEEELGALALFCGVVRRHNSGRTVRALAYTSYEEMARNELGALERAASERWPGITVAMVHRIGPLAVGDLAVAVAVGAGHRQPAFEACRFLIDSLKERVPIWKRESFDDGAVWIEGPTETEAR